MKKLVAAAILFASAPLAAQVVQDGSGSAGTTSQVVFPANTNRSYLFIQNPNDAVEKLAVNIDGAASTSAASYELAAGGSLTFGPGIAPKGPVTVAAATGGHRFIAKQF